MIEIVGIGLLTITGIGLIVKRRFFSLKKHKAKIVSELTNGKKQKSRKPLSNKTIKKFDAYGEVKKLFNLNCKKRELKQQFIKQYQQNPEEVKKQILDYISLSKDKIYLKEFLEVVSLWINEVDEDFYIILLKELCEITDAILLEEAHEIAFTNLVYYDGISETKAESYLTQIINSQSPDYPLLSHKPDMQKIETEPTIIFSENQNIEDLKQIIKDPEPSIRYEALSRLADVNLPDKAKISIAFERLEKDNDPFVKSAAMKVLAGTDPVFSKEILKDYLTHAVSVVRLSAASELIGIDYKETLEFVKELLQSKESFKRKCAVELLVNFFKEEFLNLLDRILSDSDFDVRYEALQYIDCIKDSNLNIGVVEKIIASIDEFDSYLKNLTLEVMNINQKTRTIKEAERNMNSNDIKAFKATMQLTAINTDKSLNLLIDAANSNDIYVRAASDSAMAKFKHEKVIPYLIKLLNDKNSYVRTCAADAAGELGITNQALSSVLIEKLEDKEEEVVLSTILSLKRLNIKFSQHLLEKLAESKNRKIAWYAKDAIENLRKSA